MNTYFKTMGSKLWSLFEEGVLKRGVDSSVVVSGVVSSCNEFIIWFYESRISKTWIFPIQFIRIYENIAAMMSWVGQLVELVVY